MSDIVETARARASSYRMGGPSSEHTAALLDDLANTITALRAEVERLRAALKLRQDAEDTCLEAVDYVGQYNSSDRITDAKGRVRAAFSAVDEAEREVIE